MGLGGLAAQAPPDLYFGATLGLPSSGASPQIGGAGASSSPTVLPYTNIGDQVPSGLIGGGAVSSDGTAVRIPVANQQPHWSSVLDFHNSTAPWILLGILVLYGWLHASARVSAGSRSASVVL